jgi:hypothetical protein
MIRESFELFVELKTDDYSANYREDLHFPTISKIFHK